MVGTMSVQAASGDQLSRPSCNMCCLARYQSVCLSSSVAHVVEAYNYEMCCFTDSSADDSGLCRDELPTPLVCFH